MKLLIVFGLIAVAFTGYGDCYDSKYDDYNIEELVSNDRLLESYCKCFLDKGKCTAEALDFKKWIPDAIGSNCGECTEPQKHHVAKALSAIKTKLPTYYDELKKKHDPESKHDSDLNEFINKYNN